MTTTTEAAMRRFVRLLGLTSVGYVGLFLAASPTADLLTARSASAGADVDAAVRADLGERPPPVVVVVFDALPTVALLDGDGRIDRSLFPHFAALADDATWWRNNTTVSGWTLESLGVLLTGTFPASPARAALGDVQRRNLFTLLGGSYTLEVQEPVTDLCPERLCAPAASGALPALVGDAARLWWRGARHTEVPTLPGALDGDRFDRAASWIGHRSFGRGTRPELVFLHAVLPHDPFACLPDGRRYQGADPVVGTEDGVWVDEADRAVAQLRYLLQVQAADTLLGRLLDRLRATGAYDDALVVVTADHGISFELDQPSRGAAADQYEQIMWTPLLVKASGQTTAHVDDRDVESIDLLPLVAAELGVDLPWAVDGRDPCRGGGPDRRRAAAGQKELLDWPVNVLAAPVDDEELLAVDGAEGFRRVLATDLVPGPGPAALWSTAPHGDLVGRSVDEIDKGPLAPVELVVEGPARFEDVDLGRPLPLELTGHVAGQQQGSATLAIAVDGTVAGATSLDGVGVAGRPWRVLLWPDAFVDGPNRLETYLVTGPTNHERLRSVTWRSP